MGTPTCQQGSEMGHVSDPFPFAIASGTGQVPELFAVATNWNVPLAIGG